jgi:hypothetical protein
MLGEERRQRAMLMVIDPEQSRAHGASAFANRLLPVRV